MLPNSAPNRYTSGRQLVAGDDINNLTDQLNSVTAGIVAHAGGGKANAVQLNAAINVVATSANAADSVQLSKGFVGLRVTIVNQGANAIQVFGYDDDTIDAANAATGVAQGVGTVEYICVSKSNVTGVAHWVSAVAPA